MVGVIGVASEEYQKYCLPFNVIWIVSGKTVFSSNEMYSYK